MCFDVARKKKKLTGNAFEERLWRGGSERRMGISGSSELIPGESGSTIGGAGKETSKPLEKTQAGGKLVKLHARRLTEKKV